MTSPAHRFSSTACGGRSSSAVGSRRRANSLSTAGIDPHDWYPVGGGEAGFVVPDPDDPNIVYAGEYGGYVSRYDQRTRQARNVSVYSVYNGAGSYYFGSDRANPLDTNYPYANAIMGSIFDYGDDNTKLVNHAHYTQIEWYLQDTFKASRRLTFD